jgi:integrase
LTVGDGVGTGKVYHYVNGKYDLHQRVYRMFDFKNGALTKYFYHHFSNHFYDRVMAMTAKTSVDSVRYEMISEMDIEMPSEKEQAKIIDYLDNLDTLIALHQRKCEIGTKMGNEILFKDYLNQWIQMYKEGAVRKVTLNKYYLTLNWVGRIAPNLKTCEITRFTYQQLLNVYAEYHERQTTMDFHHQLKGAILDAVDEGIITNDPTRKAIIKGRKPKEKKIKYLNQFQLQTLLSNLELGNEISLDWVILIIAKTGIRYSEALGLTPQDFDYVNQTISINKTWDYKSNGGFQDTKNKSSNRKVQIDWKTVTQFSGLIKNTEINKPIFINGKTYNSTINGFLKRLCMKSNLPFISVHGLRHTHASLLLFSGVSIASVARRLGHASITTTQRTYLHIINELENKDIDQVMRLLSGLS